MTKLLAVAVVALALHAQSSRDLKFNVRHRCRINDPRWALIVGVSSYKYRPRRRNCAMRIVMPRSLQIS